jgi:hypothetical protein
MLSTVYKRCSAPTPSATLHVFYPYRRIAHMQNETKNMHDEAKETKVRGCCSRPFPHNPLLLRLLWLLCIVDTRARQRSWLENTRARYVYRGGVTASVRNHPSRLRLVRKALTKGILAVLAAEITASPDASSNPDASNGNHDNNKEDDPLVMSRKPRISS